MNVLITGANRGIGLALAQLYCQRGDTVLGVCRSPSAELAATGAMVMDGIDVTRPGDIGRLKQQLGDRRIGLLINNAGILQHESLAAMDFEHINAQLQVNAVAPLRLTHALLEQLASGAKVVLITSRMGSIADNGSGGYYGYRMSKAALNAAGKSLAIDLKPRGIAVAMLHPGMVSTRMINFAGDVTPAQAASGLAARIDGLDLNNSGSFWHANGELLPW